MFPFNFEWVYDMGHFVFHGGLWFALSVIGMGMTYCVIKAVVVCSGSRWNSSVSVTSIRLGFNRGSSFTWSSSRGQAG